jgi:hypothetical protein
LHPVKTGHGIDRSSPAPEQLFKPPPIIIPATDEIDRYKHSSFLILPRPGLGNENENHFHLDNPEKFYTVLALRSTQFSKILFGADQNHTEFRLGRNTLVLWLKRRK